MFSGRAGSIFGPPSRLERDCMPVESLLPIPAEDQRRVSNPERGRPLNRSYLWVVATVLLSGCFGPSGEGKENASSVKPGRERLSVLATTGMIADAARIIGGEDADVTALMGPGVDPHLYQPTAQDQGKLKAATLILYNGLHLEGRMVEIFENLARKKHAVAVSSDIPEEKLLAWESGSGLHDPHIWFDVGLWRQAVVTTAEAFVKADPDRADNYRERAKAYDAELEALDQYCRDRAAEVPETRRILITSHDAFHYFGRAYGFEVVGIQGISTDSEAGLKAITDAVDLIRSKKIRTIFPETSVPHAAIERVAKDSGAALGEELYSDALGPVGGSAGTYAGMIRSNIDQIVNGLRKPRGKE